MKVVQPLVLFLLVFLVKGDLEERLWYWKERIPFGLEITDGKFYCVFEEGWLMAEEIIYNLNPVLAIQSWDFNTNTKILRLPIAHAHSKLEALCVGDKMHIKNNGLIVFTLIE
jgi:hypothetical protein